jgi:hypothetical protein
LPIIFPAVAEKVIEKIVEKVKEVTTFITANLTSNISLLIHKYPLTKPSLPTPSVVKTIMSILIIFYSLRTYLSSLSHRIVAKPQRPSASLLNVFSASIGGVRVMDAKKPTVSYARVISPSKPTPTVNQFSTSIDVRKSP